jgi:hypothetical protein
VEGKGSERTLARFSQPAAHRQRKRRVSEVGCCPAFFQVNGLRESWTGNDPHPYSGKRRNGKPH